MIINAWPINAEQETPTHLPVVIDHVACAGEIVAVVVARSARAARDAAELVDVDYDELPAVLDLARPSRTTVLAHPDLGTNKSAFWKLDSAGARHRRRRRRGHRQGARGRHRHRARVPPAAARARLHGAALDGRRPHRRADDDVVGHPDPAHPALRHRRDDRASPSRKVRVIAPDVGGGFGGKLQTTPEEFATIAVARRARQAVQVHRDPLGDDGLRPPRPRPVAEAHPGGREGRHGHRPEGRAARRPRRLRRHRRRRRARARRVDVQLDLQVPGLPVQLPDGAHQQDLGRRLPRRRPPGGHLRDRAADGRARRRGRGRPAGDPREELDQARGVPVHHRARA